MNIAFFHGKESSPKGSKYEYLLANYGAQHTFLPAMPYDLNPPGLFENTYQALVEFQPDLLIGSSLGGRFAYHYARRLACPALLFNPALGERWDHWIAVTAEQPTPLICVLGLNDQVVNPFQSIEFLKQAEMLKHVEFHIEDFEHRTDEERFDRFVALAVKRFQKA